MPHSLKGAASNPPFRSVFITGGASGLGLALARQFAADGWAVAIGDRDSAALSRVLREDLPAALGMICDVTQEDDLLAARDLLLRRWARIDVVINNAGVAVAGPIEDCSAADWSWIVDTNLLGVARGCRVFTPVLRGQGSGHIVNIASMAALLHPPGMAAYCATKAAVVALSEVMEAELAGSGVAVSVVCPAFFRTGLACTSRASSTALQAAIEQLVAGAAIGADEIATRVRAGLADRRFLILTHPFEQRIWWLKRWLPHPWFHRLMMRAMARELARRARAAGALPAAQRRQ
jgi:NAD(P)-dependent dehydrogenase (short-subunit alcohol dehydrogenase family)